MVNQIANGTMTAFANIVTAKHLTVDIDAAVKSMRAETMARYDTILADMKEAADANMGEPILRAILAAACVEIAIVALKAQGLL